MTTKLYKAPTLRFRENDPLQDYYVDGNGDYYSVARLADETKSLKPFRVPVAALQLSNVIWHESTMFELAFHVRRVMDADLTVPIILDWHGDIADGRHRVIKAVATGVAYLPAVRMTWRIEPDKLGDF